MILRVEVPARGGDPIRTSFGRLSVQVLILSSFGANLADGGPPFAGVMLLALSEILRSTPRERDNDRRVVLAPFGGVRSREYATPDSESVDLERPRLRSEEARERPRPRLALRRREERDIERLIGLRLRLQPRERLRRRRQLPRSRGESSG